MKEIANRLNKAVKLLNNPNMTSKELEVAIEHVNQVAKEIEWYVDKSITWRPEDFEQRASECEELEAEVNDTELIKRYDREAFEEACERMIYKHDANIGITWDTIDYYLDEYCLIKT